MNTNSAAIEQDVVFVGSQSAVGTRQDACIANVDERLDAAAPDIDLCRMAASGNIAAFEVMYERYHRRTYSLCLRMTEQPDRGRRSDAGSFYSAISARSAAFAAIRHFRLGCIA